MSGPLALILASWLWLDYALRCHTDAPDAWWPELVLAEAVCFFIGGLVGLVGQLRRGNTDALD